MRHRALAFSHRHPALVVAVALGAAYAVTLAPSVTLWDSGEFLSAIRTLGIPHPPGTPLFVFAARAWATVFASVDFTAAVNAGSAVATAAGVALLARTFAGPMGPAATIAAGLVAGCGSAVWQSATETEVYGYALCLAALSLAVADHAGGQWSGRHRILVAFLAGLAVPLHLSALVAGPAVVLLAATDAGGSLSLRAAIAPASAWLVSVGIGTVSPVPIAAGVVLALVGIAAPVGGPGTRRLEAIAAVAVAALAATFTLVMLVRARHDPMVNQGNPATWAGLLEVVGRAQYDVPPLWPRRAPAWLQVGNMLQYADWQFGLGLDDWPGASWWRTPVTVAFLGLGVLGARAHRRCDARTFRAMAVLLGAASLGVVAVLNLRAGPSYGWGVLPDGALREARERDYFFGLAFAGWGVWAGVGLAVLSSRVRRRAGSVVLLGLALGPMAANARALNRRREPDASLPRVLGMATLDVTPPNAVLLMAGDNDSYAVWWAQSVARLRPDVTPVTVPLLPADWYRAELRRRHGLLDSGHVTAWRGTAATLREIGKRAGASGRAMVAGVGLSRLERSAIRGGWRFGGLVYVLDSAVAGVEWDSSLTHRAGLAAQARGLTAGGREGRDPTSRYVQRLLRCAGATGSGEAHSLLETTCNY